MNEKINSKIISNSDYDELIKKTLSFENKKENSIGIKEYILDHWEGNFSLVKSFWINGFLLNIIS